MPRKRTLQNTTISCTSCRAKKRKCDGKFPCNLCVSKNIECHYVNEDKRQKRPQQAYVDALESISLSNQRLLEVLRENQNDHKKLQLLLTEGISIDKEIKKVTQATGRAASPAISGSSVRKPNWDNKKFNHLVVPQASGVSMVLGPTSVYNDGMIMENQNATNNHNNCGDNKLSFRYDNNNNSSKSYRNDNKSHVGHKNTHHGQGTTTSGQLNDRNNQFSIAEQRLNSEQISELEEFRNKYGYHSYKLFYFKPLTQHNETNNSPIIKTCVSLFFKYMYSSSFLFIHRESFLYFFLNDELDCDFVSLELVYAISALGAKVSMDETIRDEADEFYKIAKSKALELTNDKNFITESSIPKLQTLLCLAFYDLGRGELTSCWLLAGLAFRVGFDFGFELDPKDWNVSFSNIPKVRPTTIANISGSSLLPILSSPGTNTDQFRVHLYESYPFDICQVRLRIYWGSYVADRFICLVMGRSSTLNLGDVTIPDTQDIGDLTGIEDFIYYDLASSKQYACRAFHCLKAVVELLNLSEDILMKVFGPKIAPGANRFDVTTEFNLKLLQWKQNLGTELFWNKSILRRTAHNELYMGPRYTFFIIILSINRPFVSMIALKGSKHSSFANVTPVKICDDIIEDMEIVVKALKVHENTYKIFKPHILAVYSTILTISVLLWKFKIAKETSAKNAIITKLELFFEFLEKCSRIWTLAMKPVAVFRKKIEELYFDETHISHTFADVQFDKLESNINDKRVLIGGCKSIDETIEANTAGYDHLSTITHNFDKDKMANPLLSSNGGNTNMYSLEETLDIDDLIQSFLAEPINQQFLTRLDLADAMWDETLFSKGF